MSRTSLWLWITAVGLCSVLLGINSFISFGHTAIDMGLALGGHWFVNWLAEKGLL